MDEVRLQQTGLITRKKNGTQIVDIIQRALLDRLSNRGLPRRNHGAAASATPPPAPTSPAGPNGPAGSSSVGQASQQTITAIAESETGQPNRYSELVSMVGHDEAVAERLIELERRSAPNAARGELIERAIERLIRDRT